MEGTVVSRKDLFNDVDESPQSVSAEVVDYVPPVLEFEEIRHDSPEAEEEPAAEPDVLEFQLFGGSGPIQVNLIEKEEEPTQGRPISYYIYHKSPISRSKALAAAVSGASIIAEADAWARLAARNPIAEDVNAGWTPPKKRCRPGKEARLKKKTRNQRIEAERKAEAEQWKQRRRGFKPRAPKRPKTGFTFK